MKKLLLVDDELDLAEVLQDNLEAEGYDVVMAHDGQEARLRWQDAKPDLVILDVMLPSIDGLSLCREMREQGDLTPVLFLSARGQPEDRVQGLAAGGDDYMVKPFHLPEFLMRVHTMLRRQQWQQEGPGSSELRLGGARIELGSGLVVEEDGRQWSLSDEERRLLGLFVDHEGQTLGRDFLLEALWSDGVYPSTRAIERLVRRLRKAFEPDPDAPIYFHRLAGVRFRFTQDPEGEALD